MITSQISSTPLPALLIFIKWPVPGEVKTRLTPPLTGEEAALLCRFMILDTLKATEMVQGVSRILCHAGDEAHSAVFRDMTAGIPMERQQGNDLGERLETAFAAAFADGRQAVAVIGSDAPHLPPAQISEALKILTDDASDVVFVPSADGGYCLLAMKRLHCELFREIPWSSGDVLDVSLTRATAAGLRTTLLQPCFDLDTVDDLRRLASHPDRAAAPLTREFLRHLDLRPDR